MAGAEEGKLLVAFRHGVRKDNQPGSENNPSIFGSPSQSENCKEKLCLEHTTDKKKQKKIQERYDDLGVNVNCMAKVIYERQKYRKVVIVCSPFKRTIQTANIIKHDIEKILLEKYGTSISIQIEIDEDIREIGEKVHSMEEARKNEHPNLRGLKYSISFNTDPTVVNNHNVTREYYYETEEEGKQRYLRAIEKYERNTKVDHILVSHGHMVSTFGEADSFIYGVDEFSFVAKYKGSYYFSRGINDGSMPIGTDYLMQIVETDMKCIKNIHIGTVSKILGKKFDDPSVEIFYNTYFEFFDVQFKKKSRIANMYDEFCKRTNTDKIMLALTPVIGDIEFPLVLNFYRSCFKGFEIMVDDDYTIIAKYNSFIAER